MSVHASPSSVTASRVTYERQRLEDVGYMTCMTLTLLGNYAQTGHFGGPLAYTPFNVAAHLAGPELGGLRYDYRRPKHPYGDKFMLAAGHCAPTCYALWMILGQAMYRKYQATGDRRYYVAPDVAMLPVDALGFRRGAGALKTLLADQGLVDHPLFAQAEGRGIRALAGHIESTDVTNDVNGGPSGVGIASAAGKAAFWNIVGAPMGTPKVIALEGEFAMTEGHAQEIKTQAIALQVGKRLRIFLSDNNAGIDDALIGGVVAKKFEGYRLIDQWTSYGWNVFSLPDGHDYDQIVGVLKTMEEWDPADRRPMIVIGKTIKGYWPGAVNGKIPGAGDQVVGYPSHPYAMKMNSEYFVALARTFEERYGVEFSGIRQGAVTDARERLIQFKTNIDVAMSVLDQNGLGDWLADRLVEIGDAVTDDLPLRIDVKHDPFLDDRLRVANLPEEPQTLTVRNSISGAEKAAEDRVVPQGRRGGGSPPRNLRDGQVVESRHGQSRVDAGRRPVGVDQPGARQHLGALRSRDQSAGDAAQGGDSGGRKRVQRHRSRGPERVTGPRPVRGRVGGQRHLRRLHAVDVLAGARLEPAEPGQRVPHGRLAHPRGALGSRDRRRRADTLRDLRTAGVEAVPARPGHQSELLGLQRRGSRVLRRGGDRRAREEGRGHRHRSGAPRLSRGRSPHVRRPGCPGRRQGPLRHSRLRGGQAAARLRGRAGIELDVQPGQRAAAPGSRPAST